MRFFRVLLGSISFIVIGMCGIAVAFEIGDDDDAQLTIKFPKLPNVTESCLDNYSFASLSAAEQLAAITSTYTLTSNTTWTNTEKVIVRAMTADEYGFDEDNTWRDGDDTRSCSQFSEKWDTFKPWESGTLIVANGARLTIDAGISVEFDSDFRLLINDGSLHVTGTDEKPVKLKGSQWHGIEFSSSATSSVLDYCVIESSIGYKPNSDSKPRGAVRLFSSNVEFNNCTIKNNEAFYGGGVYISGSSPTFNNTLITGNKNAGRGGGVYVNNGNPLFIDSQIIANEEATVGGGVYLLNSSSARFYRTMIANNEAQAGGGVYLHTSSPEFVNSLIVTNSASAAGGGFLIDQSSSPDIINSVIAYNLTKEGGGIYFNRSSSSMVMSNSIVSGNEGSTSGNQIYANAATTLGANQNNIIADGSDAFSGASITATLQSVLTEPALFVNPPAETGMGGVGDKADWRLSATSPGINSGLDSAFPSSTLLQNSDGITSDYLQQSRIFLGANSTIDIGALEVQNNPPLLLASQAQAVSVNEDDDALLLTLCGERQDDDVHPTDTQSTLLSWVTQIPEEGYGELKVNDGGSVGPSISSADVGIENDDGTVFFEPEDRSESYQVQVTCVVKDVIEVMAEDGSVEEDKLRSLFSVDAQTTTINVTANNDAPAFANAVVPGSAQVDELYQLELDISDPDSDNAFSSITVRAIEKPSFATLLAPSDDEPKWRIEGTPTEEGEFNLLVRASDAGGLFSDYETTINVTLVEIAVTIDAGDDLSGASNDEISLKAVSPTDESYDYQWQITDEDDTVISDLQGKNVLWTAVSEGEFTATLVVSEEGEEVGQDSIKITIADGFTEVPPGERVAPSEEQEQTLNDMNSPDGAGDRTTVAAVWAEQTTDERVDTISTLAALDLSSAQRSSLLTGISDTVLSFSTESPPAITQVNKLLGAMDNIVIESEQNTPKQPNATALNVESDFSSALESLSSLLDKAEGLTSVQVAKAVEVINELAMQQTVSTLENALYNQYTNVVNEILLKSLQSGIFVSSEGEWFSLYIVNLSGPAVIGASTESGVQLTLDSDDWAELQSINGAANIKLGMASVKVNARESYAVETSSLDNSNISYDTMTFSSPYELSIPVTEASYNKPAVTNGPQGSAVTVLSANETNVSFTANNFGNFILANSESDVATEPDTSSTDDSSGCFMDGLLN